MVFVADDLAAWLIFILAEAGRKRLTALGLGREQERALRSAATVAVQRTAAELQPGDEKRAEHLAMVSRSETRPRAVSWGLLRDRGRGWDHLGMLLSIVYR